MYCIHWLRRRTYLNVYVWTSLKKAVAHRRSGLLDSHVYKSCCDWLSGATGRACYPLLYKRAAVIVWSVQVGPAVISWLAQVVPARLTFLRSCCDWFVGTLRACDWLVCAGRACPPTWRPSWADCAAWTPGRPISSSLWQQHSSQRSEQQHLPLLLFICRNHCCGHNIHHRSQTVFQQHLTLVFFIGRNLS
jgi:hypothetical protein